MDLLFSSPVHYSPSTPISHRTKSQSFARSNHKPLNSSPLAHDQSSPFSSPVADAQARRQSQYKSRVSSGPQRSRPIFAPNTGSRTIGSPNTTGADSQKAMLRDRFKQRCLKRAERARAKAHASKRKSSPNSDVFNVAMDDDMEESDGDLMQDELYQRIMINQSHKQRHAYLRSYYSEVGSSFDPDMEDAAEWEHELHGMFSLLILFTILDVISVEPEPTQSSFQPVNQDMQEMVEMTPEELEQAELEAYAEECERQAAFADFEDIPYEELFNDEDLLELMTDNKDGRNQSGDVDMDTQ
ncbi:uncharacterized protein C8R40DRAFT_1222017 [Lentinula edodes]|uniref:uncharacterized protein n=1 Tax=Lentinula edodes TaxID=5353 RepID=UPI001E8EAE55|nr:uncharacterized protein C8R40DRAFT_1222017 [Lentinula edodes]KAH7878201.1 hypothetical protein C8R40DRAFT_1222017 [Lentinula edodes]KAJ3912407.1 hypothetical protein F5877DRAFT_54079 [Lentinula edodes]